MGRFTLFILTIIFPALLNAQTCIYDIQYTTVAGDGTYPSTYNGTTVTTGGIVSAVNFSDGRFFITSSKGGAWNGLFVYDKNYSPEIGDSIILTGSIYEYKGFTELTNISSYSVINSGNVVPAPELVSSNDISNNEAYEGVLVQISNCSANEAFDAYGNWLANDGSGNCEVRTGIFSLQDYGFGLAQNYPFESVKGVVCIHYGTVSLHPRFIDDYTAAQNALVLSTSNQEINKEGTFSVPVYANILNQTQTINNYTINLQYDKDIVEFSGYETQGTLSESGSITNNSTSGNIQLDFNGNFSFTNQGKIINLQFSPIGTGDAQISFSSCTINSQQIDWFSNGIINVLYAPCDIPIGDTLTVVQRPILNIPSILMPDQDLTITCFAPETTTNWEAELIFDNITLPLNIENSNYDSNLKRWNLSAKIPQTQLYELYDLQIKASNNISDNVTNAVKIIDQYKDDYYFVHITDTHLPTHLFYDEPQSAEDLSEIDDLYEVIKDINLIQPEFVLLTGDLINEGELEDFECRRNHTKAVDLLSKLEVPLYLVPGNHDLGGWESTPPSQGTARREWWRFFGWSQQQTPPVKPEYYTHDYSFDYGNVHFVGLESYDNYDSYMYDVYGGESFIPSQITWLKNDLQNASSAAAKVLFYHFDFKEELNLSALGVDMALWGHIHSNSGNINSKPYNLATDKVCDGRGAYRIIRVNNGNLKPEHTTYSNDYGNELLIQEFQTVNNGSLNKVSALIKNKNNQAFANGLVKFIMPKSEFGYAVRNGTLEQSYSNASNEICYIRFGIPSNNNIEVSIEVNTTSVTIEEIAANSSFLIQNYPNPFTDETHIEFTLKEKANIELTIFDISGRKIKNLVNEHKLPGEYTINWDGSDAMGNTVNTGVYFYKYSVNGKQVATEQMIFGKK